MKLRQLVEPLEASRGAAPDAWIISMQWAAITKRSNERATLDAFQRIWSLKEVRRCTCRAGLHAQGRRRCANAQKQQFLP